MASRAAGSTAIATDIQRYGLAISEIRAVGDIRDHHATTPPQLRLTASLGLSGGALCTYSSRAYIDAKHAHVIAAAYEALASKTRVSINHNDSLLVRGGACGISFVDVDYQ